MTGDLSKSGFVNGSRSSSVFRSSLGQEADEGQILGEGKKREGQESQTRGADVSGLLSSVPVARSRGVAAPCGNAKGRPGHSAVINRAALPATSPSTSSGGQQTALPVRYS